MMDPNLLEKLVRAGTLAVGLTMMCLGIWHYDPRIAAILAGFSLVLLGKGWL